MARITLLSRSRFWLLIGVAVIFTVTLGLLAPLAGGGVDLVAAFSENPFDSHRWESADALIFWQTRVPRVGAALLVGGALALSGLAFQAVLRNPLSEPYILGVSAGAAAGKAAGVLVLPAALAAAPLITPFLCFVGALIPLLFLQRLALRARRFNPVTLLLAGTMLNIILSAGMMLIQVFAHPDQARQIAYWWLGGLDIVGYAQLTILFPLICIAAMLVIFRSRAMNLLSINSAAASHLGVNVGREITLLLAAGTLLAACSVALCGPIGFVGLLVPHVLRGIHGADHRLLAPLSVIYGAGFLVLCDLLGWRGAGWLQSAGFQIHNAREIPAGVITALIGGPIFLLLLLRRQNFS